LSSFGIINAKLTEAIPDYKNGKEIIDNNVEFSEMFKKIETTDFILLRNSLIFIED